MSPVDPKSPKKTSSCFSCPSAARAGSPKSIKQNARHAVKLTFSVALLALGSAAGWAAPPGMALPDPSEMPPEQPEETPAEEAPPEETPSPPATESSPQEGETPELSEQEPLPDIEARVSQLTPLKMSTSKRVYLFARTPDPNDPSGSPEKKLILLKNGEENIMALRVLRNMPDTQQIIGKRIKSYPGYEELALQQPYVAIEKISDIIPPPPTQQDQADMMEVEPAPPPFDPDLDAGSSPDPNASDARADSTDNTKDEDEKLGQSIEEKVVSFERQKIWFTAGIGSLRNTPGGDTAAGHYTGGGFRVGKILSERLFAKNETNLDALVLEGGLYFYKIAALDTESDSYTVVPLLATLRYDYFVNEDFAPFVYAGLIKNTVVSSQNSDPDRVNNLSLVAPALGVGGMYRIGPQWYARLDAGIDIIGLSLMLRF